MSEQAKNVSVEEQGVLGGDPGDANGLYEEFVEPKGVAGEPVRFVPKHIDGPYDGE